MSARYEVQMLIGFEWGNVWQVDDKPQTFASRQEELDSHLADMREAVAAGDLSDCDSAEDFRIVEVQP